MNNSNLIAFLRENLPRLRQKSPKFFVVWGRINMALLFFGGVPTLLNYLQNTFTEFDFNAILPSDTPWLLSALKICAELGAWGKFMNMLTVSSNHEIVEDNGTLIQKPCDDLPFTAKQQEYKVIEPKQIDV